MRRSWKSLRSRLWLILAVIGPGFIAGEGGNDAGGIWTYSVAGAQFGYSLLWAMIPATAALIVVQEMAARMGAVTGKGLSDLIREEFGFRITFFLMIALVVTNFANVIAEFAGVASSLELFGVSRYIVVPIAAAAVWLLVVQGTYGTVEKIFLTASAFYVCYIVAGLLAGPDWLAAARATFTRPAATGIRDYGYVYMLIGLVGTTISPWMQFYLQASVVEKGVTVRQYRASRWDVIIGSIFAAIVAWFIIVACAATLHTGGIRHHERGGGGAGVAAAGRRVCVPAVRRRTAQRVAVRGDRAADHDRLHGLRGPRVRVGPRQEVPRGAGLLLALHAPHRHWRRRPAPPELPDDPHDGAVAGRQRHRPAVRARSSC